MCVCVCTLNVQEAFDVLGFEKDEKMALYRTVAAILHLGNIKLRAKSSRDDQAEVADPSGECQFCRHRFLIVILHVE